MSPTNNNFKYSSRRTLQMRTGFSLIEILVVIVVLLIGIMAILSLFPPGFLAILKTANKTTALSLVRQQIETEKNQNNSIQSIVSTITHDNNTFDVDPNALPDDLKDYNNNNMPTGTASGTNPYYVSNINRFRRIIGESFRIPISTSNANKVYGGAYMMRFGPVVNKFDITKSTDGIKVYGSTMEHFEMSSSPTPSNPDPRPILKNASQYGIDYDNARISFYPRRAKDPANPGTRYFRITYDYYSPGIISGSGIISVVSVIGDTNSIAVPDDNTTPADQDLTPVWQDIFDQVNNKRPPNFKGFKRNSEDVSRQFQLKSTTPVEQLSGSYTFPDDDPYSYVWLSKQQPNSANAGVLVFNPTGHNEFVQNSTGTHPLTARIDYTTFDNHIIRDERSMPNQAPYVIRLSIPQVLTNGDQLKDNLTYNGMFADPAKYDSPDILIYNASTGEEISSITKGIPGPGVRLTLNAKDGIIKLNPDDVASKGLQSASLKVFYRAQNEWGMQILKANAHYIQTDTPTSVNYNNFYIGGSVVDGSNVPIGDPYKIYLPLCEAGKTVVVGEFWINTGAGSPTRYSGEIYQVNDDSAQFLSVAGGNQLTWINVRQQHPNAIFVYDPPSGLAVSNVQGGSVKARAIWRSGDHWNKIDNDTFIAPTNSR